MQQHPIPQNITGFEFKLIGDMTIKQFAYLAGGLVMGYLTLISPFHPLLRFPLTIFIAILGVALAFLPIEGRPLDRWITNFIRALFAPSQYMFHKESQIPEFLKAISGPTPIATTANKTGAKKPADRSSPVQKGEKFAAYLQTLSQALPQQDREEQAHLAKLATLIKETPPIPGPKPATRTEIPHLLPQTPEQAQVNQVIAASLVSGFIPSYQSQSPTAATTPVPPAVKQSTEQQRKEEKRLFEENERLKEELLTLRQKTNEQKPTTLHEQLMTEALGIEKRLQEALSEKERLASELAVLRNKLSSTPAAKAVTPMPPPKPLQSEKVHFVAGHLPTQVGAGGFLSAPNIISGVIKDAKGETLPNIIVEIKDQTGTPVRAFKTNKLGQFSGATPLADGRYTIELEDPKNIYTFDVIAIELHNSVFSPIEILAKDEEVVKKQSQREQLHQALFGQRPAMNN